MKISQYSDAKPAEELPGVLKWEVINADDGAPNFIMRVFEVQPGVSTPSHSHDWEHEVYVLDGQGVAISPQGETSVSRDSVVFVPPNEHHCFKNNGNKVLRFICVIPIVG
jgi:quercetin dioxygenase-like cupin family protein